MNNPQIVKENYIITISKMGEFKVKDENIFKALFRLQKRLKIINFSTMIIESVFVKKAYKPLIDITFILFP